MVVVGNPLVNVRLSRLVMVAACLAVSACDGGGGGEAPVVDSAVDPDVQVIRDLAPVDRAVPDVEALPDLAGADQSTSTGTFSLKGTISFGMLVSCGAGSATDCEGTFCWGITDQPPSATSLSLLKGGFVMNAKAGTAYSASALPVKPKIWVAGFLDDNDTVNPASPLPDMGDPVYFSQTPFSPESGETVTHDIEFKIRLP
jgi:hypothetical protein